MSKNSTPALIAGLVVFTIAFLVSRLQFFACPTIEISNDTGEYIGWINHFLSIGKLPPNNYIPIGYPVVINILTGLHNSLYSIVYFQIAVTFISFCVFLYAFWKFYDKLIFYVAVACLSIYVQVPNNLYYDIYLLSESLYNSTLVLLAAAMIYFVYEPGKRSNTFLSLALALPILFRPTGIFTIVIFGFVLVYLAYTRRTRFIKAFVIPYLAVYLVLAIYSQIASGNALFFYARMAMEYTPTKVTKLSVSDSIYTAEFHKLTRADRAFIQYKNYTYQSQMYTRIEEANQKYFERNFAHTSEWGCCSYEWLDSTKTAKREAIFKEFYDNEKMGYLTAREQSVKQTKLFKLYDVFQNLIIKKLILNWAWVALMFISFIVATGLFLFSNMKNGPALLLMLFIMINLGTFGAVLAGNHLPLARYSYPAEFIFLLQLPFLIALIRERTHAVK